MSFSCNTEEFIPTFVPISQFEFWYRPDMDSNRIAEEVTLPSLDISNVENVFVENNVVVSSTVRNSINEIKSKALHEKL